MSEDEDKVWILAPTNKNELVVLPITRQDIPEWEVFMLGGLTFATEAEAYRVQKDMYAWLGRVFAGDKSPVPHAVPHVD